MRYFIFGGFFFYLVYISGLSISVKMKVLISLYSSVLYWLYSYLFYSKSLFFFIYGSVKIRVFSFSIKFILKSRVNKSLLPMKHKWEKGSDPTSEWEWNPSLSKTRSNTNTGLVACGKGSACVLFTSSIARRRYRRREEKKKKNTRDIL